MADPPSLVDLFYDDLNDHWRFAAHNAPHETALYPFHGLINTEISSHIAVTHPITGERIGSLGCHPQASFVATPKGDNDPLVGKRHPDFATLMTFRDGHAPEGYNPNAAYLGHWLEVKRLYDNRLRLSVEDWMSVGGLTLAQNSFSSHVLQVCDQVRYAIQHFETCYLFPVFLAQGMLFTLLEFLRPEPGQDEVSSNWRKPRKQHDPAKVAQLNLITRRPRPHRVLYYLRPILTDPGEDGRRRLSEEFLEAMSYVRSADPARLTLRPSGSHFAPQPSGIGRSSDEDVKKWTAAVRDIIDSLETNVRLDAETALGLHDSPKAHVEKGHTKRRSPGQLSFVGASSKNPTSPAQTRAATEALRFVREAREAREAAAAAAALADAAVLTLHAIGGDASFEVISDDEEESSASDDSDEEGSVEDDTGSSEDGDAEARGVAQGSGAEEGDWEDEDDEDGHGESRGSDEVNMFDQEDVEAVKAALEKLSLSTPTRTQESVASGSNITKAPDVRASPVFVVRRSARLQKRKKVEKVSSPLAGKGQGDDGKMKALGKQ
ncbi:hypothetical protein BV25DRAFT_1988747 [Artomyces pyxidatus]|uniref:Uncharacterized protein n=1 Tax=Artomyces pyxidatus TaxID=48021 RepID=A0ACB8TD12_9AGAM|nr:hypothetical protein BV25DRAFT_1988747 [Artomyces pyxidatus]